MYNLRLVDHYSLDHELLDGILCFFFDSYNSRFFALNKSKEIVLIENHKVSLFIDLSKFSEIGNVIAITEAQDPEMFFIFTEKLIFSFCSSTLECNSVGSADDKVLSVSPSPDQKFFVMITDNNFLLLLGQSLNLIVETSLNCSYSPDVEMVSVGWGSKQTQFHGSEGKQAAFIVRQQARPILEWDDRVVRVSWRGDGQFFATSSINFEKGYREIRVWDTHGYNLYTSEVVDGLEHTLSWKPEGNLIASSFQGPNSHQIVFFEKNGLIHGQFALSCPRLTFFIKNLQWSTDSKILLIHGIFKDTEKKGNEMVYLYSSRNYHWYLKQTLAFNQDQILRNLVWHQSQNNTLYLFFDKKCVYYKWMWDYNSHEGEVCVIDGCELQITSFNQAVMPPPMYAFAIMFKEPVNDVFIGSSILVTLLNKIIMIDLINVSSNDSVHNDIIIKKGARSSISDKFIKYSGPIEYTGCIKFPFLVNDKAFAILFSEAQKCDSLIEICFKSNKIKNICSLDNQVIAMDYNKDIIILGLVNGSLMEYSFATNCLREHTIDGKKYNKKIELIKICYVNSITSIIGLENSRLYLNDKLINSDCTSFLLHGNYLLIACSDSMLRIFSLDKLSNDGEECIEDIRRIEKGSKLVTSLKDDAKVIFEMPRGNLETVYPRKLLLEKIKEVIDNGNYDSAFDMMKRHRINFNLLIDHDYKKFLDNVDKIIDQIGNDEQNICLLLSELSEDDCTQSLYSFAYDNRSSSKIDNKLDKVCEVVRNTMETKDEKKFFIPILLTFVKKKVPLIDKALLRIKSLQDKNLREASLKYLLYMIDVNSLCSEALGTYDFEMFMIIAEKAQKDPKEYQAFFNELKSIKNESYLKYRIDMHLKRFEKALKHLNDIDNDYLINDCLTIVKKYRLYTKALEIFKNKEKWLKEIWKEYGNYLLEKKYFDEAGYAFKNGGDTEKAFRAFQLSGNWNLALLMARHESPQKYEKLSRALANNLEMNCQWENASYIYSLILNDMKEAARVLIKGKEWDSALRIVSQCNDYNLMIMLKKGLEIHYDELKEQLTELHEKLQKYSARIEDIRKIKIEKFDFDQCKEEEDLESSLSSYVKSKSLSGSLQTRKTRTSKKQEFKKYSIKEGSVNEDVGLMMEVKNIVKTIDDMQESINTFVRNLYDFHYFEQSSNIQKAFSLLLECIKQEVPKIWMEDENRPEMSLKDILARRELKKKISSDLLISIPPKLRNVNWKFALLDEYYLD